MNGKTVKILSRYAKARGLKITDLKREWTGMNAKQRFQKRQTMLSELKK